MMNVACFTPVLSRFLPVCFLRRAIDFRICFVALTLLFVWVVDDSLEMSECGLCKQQKGADRKRKMEGEGKEVSSRADSGYR